MDKHIDTDHLNIEEETRRNILKVNLKQQKTSSNLY